MSPILGLLALFMLAKPSASTATTTRPPSTTATPPKPGTVRVIGQVLQIPLSDGNGAIIAKLDLAKVTDQQLDAIVIARGIIYGSRKGEVIVVRAGSIDDARAIADEIRGKF